VILNQSTDHGVNIRRLHRLRRFLMWVVAAGPGKADIFAADAEDLEKSQPFGGYPDLRLRKSALTAAEKNFASDQAPFALWRGSKLKRNLRNLCNLRIFYLSDLRIKRFPTSSRTRTVALRPQLSRSPTRPRKSVRLVFSRPTN
jgi:hypothetical protein